MFALIFSKYFSHNLMKSMLKNVIAVLSRLEKVSFISCSDEGNYPRVAIDIRYFASPLGRLAYSLLLAV